MKLKHIILSLGLAFAGSAMADGLAFQLTGGLANNEFSGNTQNLWLNDALENSYSVNKNADSVKPFAGVGLAYTWNYSAAALSLGVSGYYLKSKATGVNTPFINDDTDYDTLNYSAKGTSYAVMLEPKIAYTAFSLQPYLLAGVGMAFNRFSGYTEVPTDSGGSASPTNTPFSDKRTNSFAYEFGAGLQYQLPIAYAPMLAFDYRYMNLGKAGLGEFAGQTTSDTLSFGKLSSGITTCSLIWQF